MISEFKIHKSSMLYDNKTGVIFEKPYHIMSLLRLI